MRRTLYAAPIARALTTSIRVQLSQVSAYRNSSSTSGGAGSELSDPVQLARECIPDSECYGFDNLGWRGPVVLPAVMSDRPGSCLYIYQEGK